MSTVVKDSDERDDLAGKVVEPVLTVYLRDIEPKMVSAWREEFKSDHFSKMFKISEGDIFKGGPAVDAIVSPANSFGFMDGGIDLVYSLHFGWQMMERLQKVIRSEHGGELLVGDAIVIPAYASDTDFKADENKNDGKLIKYLISAPTMRVPLDVSKTVNAYLAFRACLRAVNRHNLQCKEKGQDPIRSVLCPGLGTCVGSMPFKRCAVQMRTAYEAVMDGKVPEFVEPERLEYCTFKHEELIKVGQDTGPSY